MFRHWKREFRAPLAVLVAALLTFVLARMYGPRCLQGPYLQSPTTNSIVIRWRTTAVRPIECTLRFGTQLGQLTGEIHSRPIGDEHEVILTNLLAGMRYYYSLHTSYRRIAGGEKCWFRTLPQPGSPQPLRAWILGDSGTGDARAAAVRDGFKRFAGSRGADLILMLGDNAYENGTRFDHHRGLFLPFREWLWNAPLWPALGNHDVIAQGRLKGTYPFHDFFTLPQRGQCGGAPSGQENYYSFDHGNVHFVCLDSTELTFSNHTAMVGWLAKDLEAAERQDWLIAYWHHPPYSMGHHDSDVEPESRLMRMLVLSYLERYGADLVLNGHNHSYGRSHLLQGHFGEGKTFNSEVHKQLPTPVEGKPVYRKPARRGANQGTIYVVAGCSGKLDSKPLDHPAMEVRLNVAGSVVLDVEGARLDFNFVDEKGTARDTFRLLKQDRQAENQ